MNNFINGYISRNSIIHKMNPTLKMLMFISFMILIFIPIGFMAQMIVWLIVSSLFFVAKLPSRIYFSTIKSIIFMFLILFFINWFTYRDPGAINFYDLPNGKPNNIFGFNSIGLYQDRVLSNIFDGKNFFNSNNFHLEGNQMVNVQFQREMIPGERIADNIRNLLNKKEAITYQDFLSRLAQIYPEEIKTYTVNGAVDFSNFKMVVSKVVGAELTGIRVSNSSGVLNIFPVYEFKGYALSIRTLIQTIFIAQKIYMMILLATILTTTSTSIELTFAIEQLLSPFKLLRLPVNALAMTISIAIRFVPSLLLESQRILNAQASRGIDFKNGKFWERANALISLIVPMVSIAFRNAGELSNAMEARSYDPRYARTRYRVFEVHHFDWLFYLFLMILVGFGIFITAQRLLFAPLGSPEWLVQGYATNIAVRS